jgi:hypothetical protein
MPLITCRGACISQWVAKGTTIDSPNISPAIKFNGEAVDGFCIRPGYRGGCVFCPDCVQAGKHKIASTKPGVPEQCIVCVGTYQEEEANIQPAGSAWTKKELVALGTKGMVSFPLLSHPLAAWHLQQVNDLAHACKDATDALLDYEIEASGNPADENPGGELRWMRRNFNISNNALGELMDVLHKRMREECAMRTALNTWLENNPASAGAAGVHAASAETRHEGAVDSALLEGFEDLDPEPNPEGEAGAQNEDPQLTDLRRQLNEASQRLKQAKDNVTAVASEMGQAKERLDAATDRACKKKAAAAGASRPKPKTKGTGKSKAAAAGPSKKSGPKKTVTKAKHDKVRKSLARQTYQSQQRHCALRRLSAIREAERQWILDYLNGDEEALNEFNGLQDLTDVELDTESNPDDSDYHTDEEDSDAEDEN